MAEENGKRAGALYMEGVTTAAHNRSGFGGSGGFSRRDIARVAGTTHDFERDIYKAAGYPSEDALRGRSGLEYFWSMYSRNDVAGRIIELFPSKCWGKPPTFLDPDGDAEDMSPETEALNAFAERVGLWRVFEQADRLTRLGEFAITLMAVEGQGATDADFRKEFGPFELDHVMYLRPYSQRWSDIREFVTDPGDPRFGEPKAYTVDLSGGVANFEAKKITLDWSRVLHHAEGRDEDEVFGRPALMRCFNRIIDLEKVLASTGEGYWQTADPFWRVMIDGEADLTKDDREKVKEKAEEVLHQLRRLFVAQGAQLDRIEVQTPDPTGPALVLQRHIAVSSDYPHRVLFGAQSGERSSTEDMKQFLGECADRQRTHCEPTFILPLLNRLKRYGALPEDYECEIEWPPLFSESRKEMAEADEAVARAAQALAGVGGDAISLVRTDGEGSLELRKIAEDDTRMTLDPLEQEDAEEEAGERTDPEDEEEPPTPPDAEA